jgi:hypothetical protein
MDFGLGFLPYVSHRRLSGKGDAETVLYHDRDFDRDWFVDCGVFDRVDDWNEFQFFELDGVKLL